MRPQRQNGREGRSVSVNGKLTHPLTLPVYRGILTRLMERQASSGLMTTRPWHTINWAACHRQGRSRQRRIVQAVQAGAWRKVKRLRSLLVHSFAARAFAVKRVTKHAGKKTPGVDNDLWDTPEKKATAVTRLGPWRAYRPRPLKRLSIPKQNGTQRPLSIPTDRKSVV